MSESFLSAVAARQLDLRSRSDAAGAHTASLDEDQPADSQPALGVTDTGEVVQVDALSALVHQLIEQGGEGGEEGEEEGEDDDDGDDDDGTTTTTRAAWLRLAPGYDSAAMNGDTSEIESLSPKASPSTRADPPATPLLVASEHGHHESVSVRAPWARRSTTSTATATRR